MAVTAQSGIFSFGPQASKGVAAPTRYKHRAVNINLGVQDDQRLGQLEVGGLPVPTFPYKAGYTLGGGATLQPRMEDTFGWLLYGAMGKVTTAAVAGHAGSYDHKFEMSADGTAVPWMTMGKYIPPNSGDLYTDLGEIYKDMKVLGLAFQVSAEQPLTCRVDALGREFSLDDDADAWTYGNANYEDWQSIPVGCVTDGYIQVDGEELPVVQATFAWQNQPLDIRQEKVIGSPMIDDVTIITRQLTMQLVVKYNNAELYRKILTGAANGTVWSPTPFTAPLDISLLSTVNMPSDTIPYSLRCQADEVNLRMAGSIELGAGEAIMMRFEGTALDTTGNYASFTLRNRKASYTWPT